MKKFISLIFIFLSFINLFGMDHYSQDLWQEYYESIKNQPPHSIVNATFNEYADSLPQNQVYTAIDLGCGDGRDTIIFFRDGWKVLAVDANPEIEQLLKERINNTLGEEKLSQLNVQINYFENMELPPAHFINAIWSLPYCDSSQFSNVWNKITTSLQPGGIFLGIFAGVNGSLNYVNQNLNFLQKIIHRLNNSINYTFLTRRQIDLLFQNFDIIKLKEVEKNLTTYSGKTIHEHYFVVVAKKK